MKAWELLEQKGWCQGVFAKDREGESVLPHSPCAEQFCMLGALGAVYRDEEYLSATDCLRRTLGETSLTAWNDDPTRTKAEVIAALKRADV